MSVRSCAASKHQFCSIDRVSSHNSSDCTTHSGHHHFHACAPSSSFQLNKTTQVTAQHIQVAQINVACVFFSCVDFWHHCGSRGGRRCDQNGPVRFHRCTAVTTKSDMHKFSNEAFSSKKGHCGGPGRQN